MVIGQALPYGVGDTVRLVDTSDEPPTPNWSARERSGGPTRKPFRYGSRQIR